jgi:hypothetical protein
LAARTGRSESLQRTNFDAIIVLVGPAVVCFVGQQLASLHQLIPAGRGDKRNRLGFWLARKGPSLIKGQVVCPIRRGAWR